MLESRQMLFMKVVRRPGGGAQDLQAVILSKFDIYVIYSLYLIVSEIDCSPPTLHVGATTESGLHRKNSETAAAHPPSKLRGIRSAAA
jgi:hypothetical protein